MHSDELLASVLGVSAAADPDAPAANNTLLPTHQRPPKGQQGGDAGVYYQEHEHPIRCVFLMCCGMCMVCRMVWC